MRRKNDNGIGKFRRPVAYGLLLALLSLLAAPARGQAVTAGVLTVGYQKRLTVAISGAVAAYSLNEKCAEASASDGVVTVLGVRPCDTWIVVVMAKGAHSLRVHVVPPPPTYPPGFVPPEAPDATGGYSHYEVGYISDPGEVQNTFDSILRRGNATSHLHVSTVAPFSATGHESSFSFPYLFYSISNPGFHATLFDQIMTNSPLTLDGTLVRGIHLGVGRWQFHAGYSSVFAFQNIILPLQKEGVIGVGYRLPVSAHGSLTANFYSIQAPAKDTVAQSGQMASLVYEYKPSRHLDLLAELGYSGGPGVALRLRSLRPGDRLVARLRYEPERFASVGVNNFHGFFSDLDWEHQFTDRFSSDFSLSEQRFILPGFRQANFVSRLQFEYQPVRAWTLFGGGGYSRFNPNSTLFPKLSSLNLPTGVNFDTLHFGAGFEYVYSHESSINEGGQEFRASLRGGFRQFQASGYFDRQTQTPTLDFILQQVPGLQQAMAKLDLQATSPVDLAQLFQNNLALQNLGLLNGLMIHLSPVRQQWGAGITWSGSGRSRQQVRFSVLDDRMETLSSTVRTTMGTVTYSRRMGFDNTLFVSFSAFRTDLGGLPGGLHPLAEVTFQHQFHSAPRLLMKVQRGAIGGKVFEDNDGSSVPQADSRPLGGVEVVLDGTRRTRTDSHGRYQFTRVAYGLHSVRVDFKSNRAFFYTTPSRVEAELNTRVDFGVTFAAGRLFGSVRNDAGTGVGKVQVIVASPQQRYRASTLDDGTFRIAGMKEGTYQVRIVAGTLPPGYLLERTQPVSVSVVPGTPAKVAVRVEALRDISGQVRWFDHRRATFVPVPGVNASIRSLKLASVTDADGRYLFRQLAAGTYQVTIEVDGKEYRHTVTLGTAPTTRRDVNFVVTAAQTPSTLSTQKRKAEPVSQGGPEQP